LKLEIHYPGIFNASEAIIVYWHISSNGLTEFTDKLESGKARMITLTSW
jgi:hypothetical protein